MKGWVFLELKWFEDLIAVAEKGHFARAADARHLTQSALSRRIKSLETWIGTELLDRSTHPIALTPAGLEFIPTAREIIASAYEARGRAAELVRISDRAVTIACLHTLALYFVPRRISQLQEQIGRFEVSIIAETRTIEEYLGSLQSGATDIFISFSHESVPIDLDESQFPKLSLGRERIMPFVNSALVDVDLAEDATARIPYLEYSGTSFMSRVVESVLLKSHFAERLRTVYRASLAESLCTGVQQGLGVGWLPESIAEHTQNRAPLTCVSEHWASQFEIVAIRAASNNRPIVDSIWSELQSAR
ncbi:LysR family transcriptional regulator [Altererythrobacter arenosus]|uniref:LysR family transcriptional regulator n=1 Tax=Altererythrobacter arenosus TaxID=3032592 RepID=A0ABY8FRR8_9SPHN|nr:LysR family transcriptional regulator [Altererythrobacter sp. CAU 1644]WFL77713.1 LysR family transcriptional regulator [Altererythrobacter sp. CAU 1644]